MADQKVVLLTAEMAEALCLGFNGRGTRCVIEDYSSAAACLQAIASGTVVCKLASVEREQQEREADLRLMNAALRSDLNSKVHQLAQIHERMEALETWEELRTELQEQVAALEQALELCASALKSGVPIPGTGPIPTSYRLDGPSVYQALNAARQALAAQKEEAQ